MKMPVRFLSLVLALILFVPLVSHAEIDFSKYSLEELIAIKTQITAEITSRTKNDKSVLVPMGEYIIGVDIPAATYTLTINGQYAMIQVFSADDKYLATHTMISDRSNTSVGKIVLQEGQRIEITHGPIVFSPYQGLGF